MLPARSLSPMTRHLARGATLAALVACSPDINGQGTAVGNLDATLRISTPKAADIASVTGGVDGATLDLIGCDGEHATLGSGLDLSLVGASSLTLPDGVWCGVSLVTDRPAEWSGASRSGHSFSVSVELGTLEVDAASAIDTRATPALVWQLGRKAWLSARDLGADDRSVVIPPSDERAAEALAEIRDGQFLFSDDDGDLRPDDDEEDLSEDDDSDVSRKIPPGQVR